MSRSKPDPTSRRHCASWSTNWAGSGCSGCCGCTRRSWRRCTRASRPVARRGGSRTGRAWGAGGRRAPAAHRGAGPRRGTDARRGPPLVRVRPRYPRPVGQGTPGAGGPCLPRRGGALPQAPGEADAPADGQSRHELRGPRAGARPGLPEEFREEFPGECRLPRPSGTSCVTSRLRPRGRPAHSPHGTHRAARAWTSWSPRRTSTSRCRRRSAARSPAACGGPRPRRTPSAASRMT